MNDGKRWRARLIVLALTVVPVPGVWADPPPPPLLDAPFSPTSCSDVILALRPTSITVGGWHAPDTAPVRIDLEVYETDVNPLIGPLTITETGWPQDTSGGPTVIPVDPTLFQEDAHYTVRARLTEDPEVSAWTECDFWLNTSNCDSDGNCGPGGVTLLSPAAGTSFASDTQSVTVTIQNPSDPEAGMPGSSISIQLCASLSSSFGDCDALPANWQSEPSVANPGLTTDLLVTQLTDGTLLGPDMQVYVVVCSMDELDECGPADQTDFVIEPSGVDPCAGVVCASRESCDPATGSCVAPSACGEGPACAEPEVCVVGQCEDLCAQVECGPEAACDPQGGTCYSTRPTDTGGGCPGNCTLSTVSGGPDLAGLLVAVLLLGLRPLTRRRRAEPGRRRGE